MKTIDKKYFSSGAALDCALRSLETILQRYAEPSFGSMSKKDVDIMLFMTLQDLSIIDIKPQIYDIIQVLHVTRTKARNLIYESALRRQKETDLIEELKQIIIKPQFVKDGDKVCIEVDNPLLMDYIRQRLKTLGHVTDRSFSAELIKMTPDAFADLYTSILPQESIDSITEKFIRLGVVKEKGAKAVVKNVVKIIASAALGKVGENMASSVCDTLGDWLNGVFDKIPSSVEKLNGTIYNDLTIA